MADAAPTPTTPETAAAPAASATPPTAAPVAAPAPSTPAGQPVAPAAAAPPAPAPATLLGGEPTPAPIELKLPDGFDAQDPVLGDFKKLAGEVGLDSAKAQKLFDLYAKAQAPVAQMQSEYQAEQKSWVEAVHKEFGTGDKLSAAVKVANQAVVKFGGPELAKFLADSGFGNHPALVRAFHAVGRQMSEDTTAGTSSPPSPPRSNPLATMYPTMFDGQGNPKH